MAQYTFKIPIGDWSDDGHGKCEYFLAIADKPIEAIREAYFTAKKMEILKGLSPEDFCNHWQEYNIKKDIKEKLLLLGAPLSEEDDNPDRYDMAKFVVWFINQGDPNVNVTLIPEDDVPSLTFYGYDEKDRHIGHIGYGLFD